jgi:hypothetical protein
LGSYLQREPLFGRGMLTDYKVELSSCLHYQQRNSVKFHLHICCRYLQSGKETFSPDVSSANVQMDGVQLLVAMFITSVEMELRTLPLFPGPY